MKCSFSALLATQIAKPVFLASSILFSSIVSHQAVLLEVGSARAAVYPRYYTVLGSPGTEGYADALAFMGSDSGTQRETSSLGVTVIFFLGYPLMGME